MKAAFVLMTALAAAACGGRTNPPPVPATQAVLMPQEPRPAIGARPHHVFVTPDRLEWRAGPPSLPAGARMAIIHGNPAQEGMFAMRLILPDGYRVAPHFHASDEHVTVLSGTFAMGAGDRFDEMSLTSLPPGGFARMAAGTRHFAIARGETVIQLHSIGPWVLTYVNPEDDPRRRAP